ncbi:S-layer-like y domain-containing protein [Paenibacillus sediminis]
MVLFCRSELLIHIFEYICYCSLYESLSIFQLPILIQITSRIIIAYILTKDHWAASLMGKWLDIGLIKGYTDGSLKPDASMTRAEFTVLINRVFSLESETLGKGSGVKLKILK